MTGVVLAPVSWTAGPILHARAATINPNARGVVVPRQNRVTPFGVPVAVPERGTLMGNRGVLHDAEGRIRRRWTTRAWIACLLRFKGRRRRVMAPGSYTELFFLDEATALAAGHRPCAECRRADFLRFRAAWLAGNAEHGLAASVRIAEIDRVLHAERVDGAGRPAGRRTWRAPLAELPDGVLVVRDGEPDAPRLVWRGGLHAWSFGGYGPSVRVAADEAVAPVTPPSIVAAIRAGYRPGVHPSAGRVAR